MTLYKKQIVVIGSSKSNEELYNAAYDVGAEIAKRSFIVVCGGSTGIMEAACKGAKENNGMTIGILTENNPESGNEYLDIVIPTGIGFSRNHIVQNSGAAIIMIGGSYGTLNELAYAQAYEKTVISLMSKWENIAPSIIKANSSIDAVDKAIRAIKS